MYNHYGKVIDFYSEKKIYRRTQNMDDDFEYIINKYKVPANVGRRIRYTGEKRPLDGIIVGSFGHYLGIQLQGETYVGRYHPTWALTYLDDNGSVLQSYGV